MYKHIFCLLLKAIMRYMGDLPLGIHQREVECIYTILVVSKLISSSFIKKKYQVSLKHNYNSSQNK